MHVVRYAGGNIVTGSELAHAILSYGRALADRDSSDTVEVPAYNDDGSVVRAELLIGPASQLVAEEFDDDRDELEDPELLRKIEQSTRALQAPHPFAVEHADETEFPDFDLPSPERE